MESLGNLASLAWMGPEFALCGALAIVLAVDLLATARGQGAGEWAGTIAFVGSIAALVLTLGGFGFAGLQHSGPGRFLFERMLVLDGFAVFFKLLLGFSLLAAIWMSLRSREIHGQPNEGEYYVLLLASGLAAFLMAGASNLLMAYLSLEFLSLMSYVLTGFLRHNRRSGEAALKYLIYGGVASGAMIYGMSWLFGLSGTMDYVGMATRLAQLDPASRGAFFLAIVLVLTGFGYKISAVPFHMWAPDVYTGAPIPITAFLAVGSKAAGFAMLLRFFHFGVTADGPSPLVQSVPLGLLGVVMAAATMTLGNLAALGQQNVKRLLAYSSIAHAGYALLAWVTFAGAGVVAVLFYLAVYYLMNLGAFWVVMLIANATGREDVDAYRGLAWRGGAPVAVVLAIFLFSLAGLPPLAGFIGKWFVFAAGIDAKLYGLVVIGALNSVVSLYYYARIVRMMFLEQPKPGDAALEFAASDLLPLGALSLATVYLGIFFGRLSQFVAAHAQRLLAGS